MLCCGAAVCAQWPRAVCLGAALHTHYLFLSTFAWLMNEAFNLYTVVTYAAHAHGSEQTEGGSLWRYYVIGWGALRLGALWPSPPAPPHIPRTTIVLYIAQLCVRSHPGAVCGGELRQYVRHVSRQQLVLGVHCAHVALHGPCARHHQRALYTSSSPHFLCTRSSSSSDSTQNTKQSLDCAFSASAPEFIFRGGKCDAQWIEISVMRRNVEIINFGMWKPLFSLKNIRIHQNNSLN